MVAPNGVYYPDPTSEAPSVAPECIEREVPVLQDTTYSQEQVKELQTEKDLYKEIAITLSKILKSNNRKLFANLFDISGKIIIDPTSLCNIISKLLNIPIEMIHIEYILDSEGCCTRLTRIADVQDIKINHIGFKFGYNEKYNILTDVFSLSLEKVLV
jgi:hypothetical protein